MQQQTYPEMLWYLSTGYSSLYLFRKLEHKRNWIFSCYDLILFPAAVILHFQGLEKMDLESGN